MKKFFCIILFFSIVVFAQNEVQISKKELYARARDVLKESLIQKDFDKANQALEYLQANVENGAPLSYFEEYLIYYNIEKFEEAIKIYAELRRIFLDSNYNYKKERRIIDNDDLNEYLYKDFHSFTIDVIKSLSNRVEKSTISNEYKELYTLLLYSEQIIKLKSYNLNGQIYNYGFVYDTTYAKDFLNKANSFVKNYPMSEHSNYLKNQTIPFVQNYLDKLREFRENPLKHKYYTGGISIYAGKWLGFTNGDVNDVLKEKMGSSFIVDFEYQYLRFVLGFYLSYGLITDYKFKEQNEYSYESDDCEDENMGFLLGFVSYESRFLKITPFIGLGNTELINVDNSYELQFLLGLNIDNHLLVKKPSKIGGISFGIGTRFKYMVQFGDIDLEINEKTKNYGAINHMFAFELGIFFW